MKICLDIGGTNTRVALFTDDNTFVAKRLFATQQSYKLGIIAITHAIQNYARDKMIRGVAVAVAGILDKKLGIVVESPNLQEWKQKPLVQDISSATGVSHVILENDAALAALGEANYGGGKDKRIVVYLTLSTVWVVRGWSMVRSIPMH